MTTPFFKPFMPFSLTDFDSVMFSTLMPVMRHL